MRIIDWSSDVCSSDLQRHSSAGKRFPVSGQKTKHHQPTPSLTRSRGLLIEVGGNATRFMALQPPEAGQNYWPLPGQFNWPLTPGLRNYLSYYPIGFCCIRSEEHTSELQSLMRISYA